MLIYQLHIRYIQLTEKLQKQEEFIIMQLSWTYQKFTAELDISRDNQDDFENNIKK